MAAFAIYRLPYQQECRLLMQTEGQPAELPSLSALSGKEGFVMAPFTIDQRHPLLLFSPDVDECLSPDDLLTAAGDAGELVAKMSQVLSSPQQEENERYGTKGHYAIDFANFHSQILEGEFSKVVLARCCHEKNTRHETPLQLFVRACREYPRLYVALVCAYRCGTWLMATPEVLLEGDGHQWSTMSLAGTMSLTDSQLNFDEPPSPERHDDTEIGWNIKNIQEQRFVSTYITERLEQVATGIEEHGPYTRRAGRLVQLRSDFLFTLPDTGRLGELLNVLYPTPAVCGLPKDAARDFIRRNELAPRQYYSGFAGLLQPTGETHLYVSLRCMRLRGDDCTLFAGGGLLADSEMSTEWDETEAKMETMRVLIKKDAQG